MISKLLFSIYVAVAGFFGIQTDQPANIGAGTVAQIFQGGTGTSTIPADGQMLIGKNGKYTLIASSSLGGGGTGALTPWTSDIDAASYNLNNLGTSSQNNIKARTSAGLNIYSNNGTQVVNMGAGGGANVSFQNGGSFANYLRIGGSAHGDSMLESKALSNDGSTGILHGYNASSSEVFALNSDGDIDIGSWKASPIGVNYIATSANSGYVLQSNGNNAQWVSTSSLGIVGGGTGSGATTTINGVNGPNFTFSTTSDTNLGLTISNTSGSIFNYALSWIGTLANSRIASSSFWKGWTDFSNTATGLTYTNTTGVTSLTSGYEIPKTASTSNWQTGYNERLQWDGGSTNLVAATGRTSLGLTDTATLASTTWYLSTNPSNYITSSALSPYLTTANAASTYLPLVGSTTVTTLGTISTGVWNGTSISNSKIASSTEYLSDVYWNGSATGLVAATGRTSLGLGSMALESNTGSTTINTLGTVTTGDVGSTTIFGGTGTINEIYNRTKEPTGFENQTDSLISFATSTRTFTISTSSGSTNFNVYYRGNKINKTGVSTITIPAVTATYFVYYSPTGVLSTSTTAWDITAATVVPIATVYFNSTTSVAYLGDERHGMTMDSATHAYLHQTIGTRYESGFSGTFVTNNATITAGIIWDEDLRFSWPQDTDFQVFNRNSSQYWDITGPQTAMYRLQGSTLLYDNAGASTSVPVSNYVAYWIFAGNSSSSPIISVMGQRVDTTIANARANNTYASLNLNNFAANEYKVLYRIIFQNVAGSATYVENQDLRAVSSVVGGGTSGLDHGTLTGLLDDDHTQYLLVNGTRAQTTLTVSGTSSFATTSIGTTSTTGLLNVGGYTITSFLKVIGNLVAEFFGGIRNYAGYYDSTNATGTSGMILSSTGTSTKWITASGGSTQSYWSYSSTTATEVWTKPANVTASSTVKVQVWGAGGGGGSGTAASGNWAGGGGGGGYVENTFLASSLTATVTVTVGKGGNAGAVGSSSSFGTYLTAYGGGAGGSAGASTQWGSGGGGGGIYAVGANGGSGNPTPPAAAGGAPLGGASNLASTFGGGGGGQNGIGGASVYGGGGGGGADSSGNSGTGGRSLYGGGGGGAGSLFGPHAGGVSTYGGAGGTGGGPGGGTCAANGNAGSAPGGGGGGACGNASFTGGVGARGEVRIFVIY